MPHEHEFFFCVCFKGLDVRPFPHGGLGSGLDHSYVITDQVHLFLASDTSIARGQQPSEDIY